jgi:hypothetical protein
MQSVIRYTIYKHWFLLVLIGGFILERKYQMEILEYHKDIVLLDKLLETDLDIETKKDILEMKILIRLEQSK